MSSRTMKRIAAVLFALLCLACGRQVRACEQVKDLTSRKNSADYIAIVPKPFLKSVAPLLALREKQGHCVAVVTPQRIYEQFYRWPAGPKALRAFVRHAYFHWSKPAPRYLLLAGDINTLEEFDPAAAVVPTFMVPISENSYAASDSPFGDMDGDQIPEVAVGRLPADTADEAAAMAEKIIAYETAPPPGPWRRRTAAFASTGGFGPYDSTLEEITRRVIRQNFDPMFDITMTYAGSGLPYFLLPEEFGPKVIERFNEGSLFLSYIGHGSVEGVSGLCYRGKCGSILEMDALPKIDARGKNPFFFSICCLTGKFNIGRDCIAEELIKLPGGPVGVLAGSETTAPYNNALLSKDILYFLMRKRPETIGDGLLNVWRGQVQRFDPERKFLDKQMKLMSDKDDLKDSSYDHVYYYNFFGDPATRIAYPAENIEITAPGSAAAGETISVSIQSAEKSTGRLIVTLEAHPTLNLFQIIPIDNIRDEEELAKAVQRNYASANNKVAARVETMLDQNGRAMVKLQVPDYIPKETYYIKAYAWDGVADSMARREIAISSDAIVALPEPDTAVFEPRCPNPDPGPQPVDFLKIVKESKEPDVTSYLKKIEQRDKKLEGSRKKNEVEVPEWKDMPALQEKAKLNPEDTELKLRYASSLLAHFQLDEVERVLQNFKGTDEQQDRARVLRARSLFERSRYEDALKVLDEVKSTEGDIAVNALELKATIYSQTGKDEEAGQAYLTAAKIAAPDHSVHEELFYFYKYNLNDMAGAERQARYLIDNMDSIYSENNIIGLAEIILRRGGGYSEALEWLWIYYKIKQNPHALAMAVTDMNAVDPDILDRKGFAPDYLEIALELDPECAECLVLVNERSWTQNAVSDLERALAMDPELGIAHIMIARKQYELGNFEKALLHFKSWRALQDADRQPDWGTKELVTMIKAGEKEQALKVLDEGHFFARWLSEDPVAASAAYKYLVFTLAGEHELANRELNNARLLEIHDYNFLSFFANTLYYEYSLVKESIPFFQAALGINPYSRHCLQKIGQYYFENEDYANAEKYLVALAALDTSDSYSKVLLGRTYKKMGKPDSARAIFRDIMKKHPEWVENEIQSLVDPVFIFD